MDPLEVAGRRQYWGHQAHLLRLEALIAIVATMKACNTPRDQYQGPQAAPRLFLVFWPLKHTVPTQRKTYLAHQQTLAVSKISKPWLMQTLWALT
jgi:hypothetical protein